MLVLSRKRLESVVVGGAAGFECLLKVTVLDLKGGSVRLGFEVRVDAIADGQPIWAQLTRDSARRLSVEPGVALGWARWVGDRGASLSLEHYGASAPGTTVLEQFGYNVDNVVARASALLERVA